MFPALHKEMEHFSASKMFILISTVMTWARTKTLDPVGGHTTFSLCLYIYIVPGHLTESADYLSVPVFTPSNKILTRHLNFLVKINILLKYWSSD